MSQNKILKKKYFNYFLDSTVTKINTPLDLMSTQQIDVEELGNNRVRKFRID